MTVLVGAAVGAAVLLAAQRGGRLGHVGRSGGVRRRGGASRQGGASWWGGSGRRGGSSPAWPSVGRGAPARWPSRSRRRGGPDDDNGRLAAVLVEVAAVLRTGVAPAEAWSAVLGVPVPDRVPTVAQLAAAAPAGGAPLDAVVAAARVADELGAPLSGVLDQVAAAIAGQAEAEADVEAALAGPRSSARVLAWLPALGVLVGTALGADPVGVLLGGGLGTAAGLLGVALMLAGRWWTSALLRRVRHVGGGP